MEFIVIVALISKALIVYIDAAIYDDDNNAGHLTQIVPMAWPLSQYFDVLALLVPIVIGGKLGANTKRLLITKIIKKYKTFSLFLHAHCSWLTTSAIDGFAGP